jgi:protocatechuate 3,4-dioxygenase beta subunit
MIGRRTVIGGIAAAAVYSGSALGRSLTPRVAPGPFYPPNKPSDHDWDLVRFAHGQAVGDILHIEGRVFRSGSGGAGPLEGAIVEIWQADRNQRYIHPGENFSNNPRDPHFQGFGMSLTDAQGRYRFRTIKPPPYPVPGRNGPRMRAPHIHFGVVVGGEKRLITQMFFEGEALNAEDFELVTVAPELRRQLIVPLTKGAAGSEGRAIFDLVVNG